MRENPRHTIEELALHEPQVSQAMQFYIRGDLTWEETLERLVLMLVENKVMLNKEIDRLMSRRTTPLIFAPMNNDGDKLGTDLYPTTAAQQERLRYDRIKAADNLNRTEPTVEPTEVVMVGGMNNLEMCDKCGHLKGSCEHYPIIVKRKIVTKEELEERYGRPEPVVEPVDE